MSEEFKDKFGCSEARISKVFRQRMLRAQNSRTDKYENKKKLVSL